MTRVAGRRSRQRSAARYPCAPFACIEPALRLAAIILAFGLAAAAPPARAAPPPEGSGPWVVRARFADERSLALLMRRAAPWRVDREAGEVLVEVRNRMEWRMMQREGFEVVLDAALTRALLEPPAKSARQVAGIPGFACYRTVAETYAAAEALVAAHPGLAQWIDIGDSWRKGQGLGGHDLRVLRITNRAVAGPKPVLFVQGALHAREYVTAETVLRFGEQLLAGHGSDADATWIIDHHEVHLLPVANPDGRVVAEAFATRLQRKNRNEAHCAGGGTSLGVDLNRNYAWNFAGPGSSGAACDEVFRGPAALSEPETLAISAWLHEVFPDQRAETSFSDRTTPVSLDATGFYIDVHSAAAANWFPWGDVATPAPNAIQLQTLARKLAHYNQYPAQQGALAGAIGGASDDFVFGTLGVPAFTMELGGGGFFPSCTAYEASIAPGTLASLRFAARIVRAPYRLPAGPELDAVAAAPASAGGTLSISARADDARFGPGPGVEPVQAVAGVSIYAVPPWLPGAQPLAAMAAVDGAFDASDEPVRATLPAGVLAPGRHLLFLQAVDAAGASGPVSALFVDVEAALFADGFEAPAR